MNSDSKYNDYEQVIQNNQAVGFKLKNDSFFYKYDKHGGWYDADGKYFNKDAINCEPVYESSQSEDEQDNNTEQQNQLSNKLQNISLRQQNIRNLLDIVDSYPENELIHVEIDDEKDSLTDKQIQTLLQNEKYQVKNLTALVNKQQAIKLVKLQGKNIKNTYIYIYVKLFNSKQITIKGKLTLRQLQAKLQDIELIKNKDYANIQQSQGLFSLEVSNTISSRLSELKGITIQ